MALYGDRPADKVFVGWDFVVETTVMGFEDANRFEVAVGVGVGHVEHRIGHALAAGPVEVTGRGSKTCVTALAALRAIGEHVGLEAVDVNGSTVGVERTTRTPGRVASSRKSDTSRRWRLQVRLLPRDWSMPVEIHGGPAEDVPAGAFDVPGTDLVFPIGDGPGRIYVMGPALRLAVEEA